MTKGIRYKKNYLTGVIFRINFSNILQLSGKNKEAAEKFQKEIFDKDKQILILFPEIALTNQVQKRIEKYCSTCKLTQYSYIYQRAFDLNMDDYNRDLDLEDEMKKLAMEIDNVKLFTDGKEIVKVITVPKKLVNIVVK